MKAAQGTPAPRKRAIIALPKPTHRLVSHIAALRGMRATDTIYTVFREELARLEDGAAWEHVPSPWSIRPTYLERECAVLVWNPFLTPLKLRAAEAVALADALDHGGRADLTTHHDARRIEVFKFGQGIRFKVDDDHVDLPLAIATDIGKALDSASVHAGLIPARTH